MAIKEFNVTVHFSELQGIPVKNMEGGLLGKLSDIFVDYEEVYPSTLGIQFIKNGQVFYTSWDNIELFRPDIITIKKDSYIGKSRTYPKAKKNKVITSMLAGQFIGETVEYPPLGKVILDRQIVDTSGKKVVRVNDIQFLSVGSNLRVTHAATGTKSMLRRLGLLRPLSLLSAKIPRIYNLVNKERPINWKYVHAIPDKSTHKHVKISLTNSDLKKIHPADLADILEDLDGPGRTEVLKDLAPEIAAEALSEVDPETQVNILKREDTSRAAEILENMFSDEAADVLGDLSKDRAHQIISKMDDQEVRNDIKQLLSHPDHTAGGLMSTEYFQVSPGMRRSEIIKYIQDHHENIETVYDFYITDEAEKLLGACSLKDLIVQKENLEIKDIMETEGLIYSTPDEHWKSVASTMSKYNLLNIPVCNQSKKIMGVITIDDILPWALNER